MAAHVLLQEGHLGTLEPGILIQPRDRRLSISCDGEITLWLIGRVGMRSRRKEGAAGIREISSGRLVYPTLISGPVYPSSPHSPHSPHCQPGRSSASKPVACSDTIASLKHKKHDVHHDCLSQIRVQLVLFASPPPIVNMAFKLSMSQSSPSVRSLGRRVGKVPVIRSRGVATAPFRLPAARNEPNVSLLSSCSRRKY